MDQEAATTDNLANPSLTCFYNCCSGIFSTSCITSPLQAWEGDCSLLPSTIIWGIAKCLCNLKWHFHDASMSGSAGHSTYLLFPCQSLEGYQNNQSLLSCFLVPFHWGFKDLRNWPHSHLFYHYTLMLLIMNSLLYLKNSYSDSKILKIWRVLENFQSYLHPTLTCTMLLSHDTFPMYAQDKVITIFSRLVEWKAMAELPVICKSLND